MYYNNYTVSLQLHHLHVDKHYTGAVFYIKSKLQLLLYAIAQYYS